MQPTIVDMIENFTVSYAFEAGYGKKSNHFLSMGFRIPPGTDPSQIPMIRLEASKMVSMNVIQDAVMRGELSSEDAKERIEVLKLNFEGMKKSLTKQQNGDK